VIAQWCSLLFLLLAAKASQLFAAAATAAGTFFAAVLPCHEACERADVLLVRALVDAELHAAKRL
jgi:hypothetical protein